MARAEPKPQAIFGVQPDGSVRSILNDEEKWLSELNPLSIQILMDMGFDYDLVIKALIALRQNPKHNPVGEVQKAIDWINQRE